MFGRSSSRATPAATRKAFGKRIRELRKAAGLSQESLADAAGMHRTYVGAIERGEQNVSLDNITKLAIALHVSVASLFDRSIV